MCIAIVKKKNGKITDEQLENCFENNKDGAGIAFTKDKKLYVVKGIFDKKVFISKVREIEKIADGNMLIHCRIGTSGLKDKNNCHPHLVNNNLAMIHNGVLDIDVPNKSKVSDTIIFINTILKKLPKNFLENKAIKKLIEETIGDYNKLCFLDNNGKYTIINEKAGEWVDGVWYSNTSYEYSRIQTIKPVYGYWEDEDYYYNDKWYYENEEIKNNAEYVFNNEKYYKDVYQAVYEQIYDLDEDDIYYFGEKLPVFDLRTNRLEAYSKKLEKSGSAVFLEDLGYEVVDDYLSMRKDLMGEQYVPVEW